MTSDRESLAINSSVGRLDAGTVAIVMAGGACPTNEQAKWACSMAPNIHVVAADSGADHARSLGLGVDVAVGDFDSISERTQQWLRDIAATVVTHPATKNASDLELALAVVATTNPARIVVLGLGGGRVDHGLINLLVLADEGWASQDVLGIAGDSLISVVRNEFLAVGLPGSLVSLVAIGGSARVRTKSLLYALHDEELGATGSLGLSNAFIGTTATINVSEGVLLAIQPNASDYLWAPAQ